MIPLKLLNGSRLLLRITSQSDPAGACRYFDPQGHDYYLDDQELAGQWGGHGAKLLGLTGEIDPTDFKALAYNRHPDSFRADPRTADKITVLDHPNRRVGYDFSFSVPKSVTLAFELTGDQRILDAFKRSVADTMADIEQDALTRDQRNGESVLINPGNLTHATFIHRSSRPVQGVPDCQLHAHVFVMNMAHHDGRWTAVELGEVKANAPYYEALAMARLGKSLVDMGYGVRRKGKFFELKGVSDELVAKFSNRKNLIEAVAEERGITNPDHKAELGGKTREHKSESHHSPAELRQMWLDRLTPEEVSQLTNLIGQESQLPTVEESARFAIDHSFYTEAVRPTKKVLEEGLRHGVGTVTLESLRHELDQAGLLSNGDRSTTQEMLDLESGMVRFARETKGVYLPTTNAKPSNKLNQDQRKGVEHIWQSRDGVTAVRGAAGVGKTFALKVAADGIREAGFAVQALAQSNTAVKELIRKGVDENAKTITSFLMSEKAQKAVRGGTVIVDESSLVGTVELAKLFQVVEKIEARVVLVGDEKQHGAVSAGAPVRLLKDYAGIEPVEITQILRQQNLEYRLACEKFADHDILGGMDDLRRMGSIHEITDEFRTEALVLDYMAETKAKREVIVVSPTHAEAKEVTDGIREALREYGQLKGEEQEYDRLVNLNWTEAERKEAKRKNTPQAQRVKDEGLTVTQYGVYRPEKLSVAIGDSLRATGGFSDGNGHRVTNGMRFKATGFTKKGIKAVSESGIKLLIPNEDKHIAHGYVTTSYGSQGRTADVVLISESTDSFPAADRAQMYVSASRARHGVRIYTDDALALRDAVDRERVKENAHDLLVDKHEKADPITERAMFVSRTKTLEKPKEHVIQLTKSVEKSYDYELER